MRVIMDADEAIVTAALHAINLAVSTSAPARPEGESIVRWSRGTVGVVAGMLTLRGAPGRGTRRRRIQISDTLGPLQPAVDRHSIVARLERWKGILSATVRVDPATLKEITDGQARHVMASLEAIHGAAWTSAKVTPGWSTASVGVEVFRTDGRRVVYRRRSSLPDEMEMSAEFAELLAKPDLAFVQGFEAANTLSVLIGAQPPFLVENPHDPMASLQHFRLAYLMPPLTTAA